MRQQDRAHLICLAWYERGIERGVYLRDVPFLDLTPEHRDRLFQEAQKLARKTPLLPVRKRKGWDKRRWVWVEYKGKR